MFGIKFKKKNKKEKWTLKKEKLSLEEDLKILDPTSAEYKARTEALERISKIECDRKKARYEGIAKGGTILLGAAGLGLMFANDKSDNIIKNKGVQWITSKFLKF